MASRCIGPESRVKSGLWDENEIPLVLTKCNCVIAQWTRVGGSRHLKPHSELKAYISVLSSSVLDPGFFRIRIKLFFLDLDPPKIRIRSGKSGSGSRKKNFQQLLVQVENMFFFIFRPFNTILFSQAQQKLIKKSFRFHGFVKGRIRIGKRNWIHLDLDPKHCSPGRHEWG